MPAYGTSGAFPTVLALVPFSGALAQEPPAREPGQPVRVTVPSLSMESVLSVSTLTGRSRRSWQ